MIEWQANYESPQLAHLFMLLAQLWVEADKEDFADLAVTSLCLPPTAS